MVGGQWIRPPTFRHPVGWLVEPRADSAVCAVPVVDEAGTAAPLLPPRWRGAVLFAAAPVGGCPTNEAGPLQERPSVSTGPKTTTLRGWGKVQGSPDIEATTVKRMTGWLPSTERPGRSAAEGGGPLRAPRREGRVPGARRCHQHVQRLCVWSLPAAPEKGRTPDGGGFRKTFGHRSPQRR